MPLASPSWRFDTGASQNLPRIIGINAKRSTAAPGGGAGVRASRTELDAVLVGQGANTVAPPVAGHVRPGNPAVELRVENLCRFEVGLPVVPAHGVQLAADDGADDHGPLLDQRRAWRSRGRWGKREVEYQEQNQASSKNKSRRRPRSNTPASTGTGTATARVRSRASDQTSSYGAAQFLAVFLAADRGG